jgi:hypothetical protein
MRGEAMRTLGAGDPSPCAQAAPGIAGVAFCCANADAVA